MRLTTIPFLSRYLITWNMFNLVVSTLLVLPNMSDELALSPKTVFWLHKLIHFLFVDVFHGIVIPMRMEVPWDSPRVDPARFYVRPPKMEPRRQREKEPSPRSLFRKQVDQGRKYSMKENNRGSEAILGNKIYVKECQKSYGHDISQKVKNKHNSASEEILGKEKRIECLHQNLGISTKVGACASFQRSTMVFSPISIFESSSLSPPSSLSPFPPPSPFQSLSTQAPFAPPLILQPEAFLPLTSFLSHDYQVQPACSPEPHSWRMFNERPTLFTVERNIEGQIQRTTIYCRESAFPRGKGKGNGKRSQAQTK